MNIFQKIAVLVLRLFGVGVFFYGISGFIEFIKVYLSAARLGSAAAAMMTTMTAALSGGIIIAGFLYLILGLVIFYISLPLGKFVGRNLDN
jgi:hypothetical protein